MKDIQYVGGSSSAGETTSMPAGVQVGDLIMVFAFRDGNTSAPVAPSGYTSGVSYTATGTSCALRYGFRWAESTSESVGTWTNATGVSVVVYRNVAQVSSISNSSYKASGSGNSITYPMRVRDDPDSGKTWMVRAAGHRTATNMTANAPSTVPNTYRTGVDSELVVFDSNGGMSSDPTAGTQSVNASSNWVSATIEIHPHADTPISSLTDGFNGGSLDTGVWNTTTGSVTVSGGTLSLTDTATCAASFGATSEYRFDGTANWLSFRLVSSGLTSGTLIASMSCLGTTYFGFSISPHTNSVTPTHGFMNEGSATPYVPGRWYRVRVDGADLYWEYSDDGKAWSIQHTKHANSALGNMRRAGVLFQQSSSPSGTSLIDDVNILPSSGSPAAFLPFFMGGL